MTRINLNFFEQFDLDLLSKDILYRLIRLRAYISLKTEEGWTQSLVAIIDTGSPFSIIPPSIWKNISFKKLLSEKSSLYGFGSKNQSPILGQLVETQIVFIDQDRVSPSAFFRPYLTTDELSPIVLGFEDILTKTKLICDYINNSAFLEFNK